MYPQPLILADNILCIGVLKIDTPDLKIPCISAPAEVQYPKLEHEKEPF